MADDRMDVGNSNLLKRLNRSKILSLILERGTVSRSELIRHSGLNQSTISRIVDEFIKAGLVHEHSKDESVPMGRKPANLSIKKEGKIIGVIIINPSIVDIAVCDITGSVLKHVKLQMDKDEPENLLKIYAAKLREILVPFEADLMGVGVTVPGNVSSETGIVLDDQYLKWHNVEARKIVQSELDCRVVVESDAKAGALAQLCFAPEARDYSNFVFVLVDYGVWGGIIVKNRLYSGHKNMAGQFGSILVPVQESENGCCLASELDNLASETAIVSRYKELSSLTLAEDIDLSTRLIVFNGQNGDDAAIQSLKEAALYLGKGLAYINNTYAPEKIFVAGKITQLWDMVFPQISEQVDKYSHDCSKPATDLVAPSSLVWASFEGATAMVLQDIFASYKVVYRHPTWHDWAQWK